MSARRARCQPPDGTANSIRDIAQTHARVRCIKRIGRRGLSTACMEGILASCAPYVAVMDADLQHDERILPEMLDLLRQKRCDLVVGSRYTAGGGIGSWDIRAVRHALAAVMRRRPESYHRALIEHESMSAAGAPAARRGARTGNSSGSWTRRG